METLTKIGNTVTFREQQFILVSTEKLDQQMIHANFETETKLFIANDTELNGVVYANSDELIEALNKPEEQL